MSNIVVTKRRLCLLLVTCIAFLSTGCGTSMTVKAQFPSPLVKKLPLKVGLHFDNNFKNYTYVESNDDRSGWRIQTGNAQMKLFSTVLDSMFEEVVEINDLSNFNQSNGADIVMSPSVESFQYSLPAETKIKMFEVWTKFNIRVFDGQGQLIADWIMSSYGKTPTAFMKRNDTAMNEAIIASLRDAGANLSMTFTKVPEIRQWLEHRQQSMLKQQGQDTQ